MILDTTSTILEAVSDATATTTEPVVLVDYADISTSSFGVTAANSQVSTLNGTTDVTITSAPAASTSRQIKYINVFNSDSVNHDITIKHYDGTDERVLWQGSVDAGRVVFWTPDSGWLNTSAIDPATFLGLADTPSSYSGQADKIVAVNGAEDALEFIDANGAPEVLFLHGERSAGTGDGTSTSGTWVKRNLNTTDKNTISGASVSSDVITLPAGEYMVEGWAPAYFAGVLQCRLRNTSDGSTEVVGSVGVCSQAYAVQAYSHIAGVFTLAASKDLELQTWVRNGRATDGLGSSDGSNTGEVNIFSQLRLTKIG